MTTPNAYLSIARQLSFLIGRAVIGQVTKGVAGVATGSKGYGGDWTKNGDMRAEKVVIAFLSKLVATKQMDRIVLVSEESGVHEFGRSQRVERKDRAIFVVLDPIDGSNNMRPWPTPHASVGTSIAIGQLQTLQRLGTIDAVEVGLVRDIFNHLEYYAIKGRGAFFSSPLFKKPIGLRPGRAKTLAESSLAISLDKSGRRFDVIFSKLKKILRQKNVQRRVGSTVLDASRVASGEADGFISVSGNVKIHDIAAVKLIIEEAGGIFHYRQVHGQHQGDYLKALVNNKQSALIGKIGFEVVVASSRQLLHKILENLK